MPPLSENLYSDCHTMPSLWRRHAQNRKKRSTPGYVFPQTAFVAILPILLLFCTSSLLAQGSIPLPQLTSPPPAVSTTDEDLQNKLRARLAIRPDDGAAWRMLGRVLEKQGNLQEARTAFDRAAKLRPESAAAQGDLGRIQYRLGFPELAIEPLLTAKRLAPKSPYAEEAQQLLDKLPPELVKSKVETTSFQDSWANSPRATNKKKLPSKKFNPWFFRWETGTQYNSNVKLAPLSRELSPGNRDGFQFFLSPEVVYRMKLGEYETGGNFEGFFSFNEGNLRRYNLEHYQPGWYLKRRFSLDQADLVARTEYNYAYNAFDGSLFGSRNSLSTSLAIQWLEGPTWLVHWTISTTDFANDGVLPSVTSLDGVSQSLGFSRAAETPWAWLEEVRAGAEAQWANLEGSNYTYHGAMFFLEGDIPLPYRSLLTLQMGAGFREYPDFQYTPSRDETIWRVGLEGRKYFQEHWYFSLFSRYDRFISKNDAFDADRFLGGISLVFEH